MKERLVRLIEKQLGWGPGDGWSNKDFEDLSEKILLATGKQLSVTTLKRIWGRVALVANPSMATLDILAQFVSYENWKIFLRENNPPLGKANFKAMASSKIFKVVVGGFFGTFLLGFLWYAGPEQIEKPRTYAPDDFFFSSRRVGNGIPNSVIFKYNASAADGNSKIEIQQSWDSSKRVRISKEDSVATSIYYKPGFFKAKLVVADQIVKESDVFITTEDWLGIIEQDSQPIYLKNDALRKDGILAITPGMLADHSLDPGTKRTMVGLYQVRDFGMLYTDDFELSVLLKNDFKAGISVCQRASVTLLFDGGAISFPLADKGCVSELTLMTFDKMIDGKKADLSGFGVNFNEFVALECVSKNQKLEVKINQTPVFQMVVPSPAQKIVGIIIRFEGAGSVRDVVFKKRDEIIYASNLGSRP